LFHGTIYEGEEKEECQIKMEGLPSDKQMFLLISSHVSAQTGHHQVILEEYVNGDRLHINCNGIIKLYM
jgi:hypothetical protein